MKDIRNHPLLEQLTDKQRGFVLAYIESNNKIEAIKAAGYKPKDDINAEIMARKNFKHPVIKQLLAEAMGIAPSGGILSRNELLLMLSEGARKTKHPGGRYKYLSLLAQMKGWIGKGTPTIAEEVARLEALRKRKS